MNRIHVWLATLALILGLAPAACGGASEGSGTGVVRGVDREQARVTLEHGAIPGLMKAMTMSFDVSEPGLLDGLEAGDRVDFEVRYADGAYTVISIRPR